MIPKEVREKLRLSPQQRLQVVEKGDVIILVPEAPLKSLKGTLKGMSMTGIREKKYSAENGRAGIRSTS